MGRIKEADRLTLLDNHAGHWAGADALTGGPVVLDLNSVPPSTLTLAQFEQLREDYQAKRDAENELENTSRALPNASVFVAVVPLRQAHVPGPRSRNLQVARQ